MGGQPKVGKCISLLSFPHIYKKITSITLAVVFSSTTAAPPAPLETAKEWPG